MNLGHATHNDSMVRVVDAPIAYVSIGAEPLREQTTAITGNASDGGEGEESEDAREHGAPAKHYIKKYYFETKLKIEIEIQTRGRGNNELHLWVISWCPTGTWDL